MKRKSITIYTVLISALFIFCIGFFSYNIVYEYQHGKVRTEKNYDFVLKSIKKNGDKTDFNKLFENSSDYEAVIIKRNGRKIFSYPEQNVDKLQKIENTRFVSVYTNKVSTFDAEYEVTLALYILRPSVIFYYARFAFIAILVATLFTIILIIYYNVTQISSGALESEENSKNEEETSASSSEENGYSEDTEENSIHEEDVSWTQSDFPSENVNGENGTSGVTGTPNANLAFEQGNVPPSTKNASDEGAASCVNENNSSSQEQQKAASKEEKPYEVPSSPVHNDEESHYNEAKALFSSTTGFYRESQLTTRVESELIRAASEEQELSLIMLKIPSLNFDSDAGEKISTLIHETEPNRHLLFEYSTDGICMIRKNVSIDDAEKEADILISKINSILEGTELKAYAGISSRSIRIVSEGRLINEAEEALKHSMEENESQITAFHVDVEKYREFLRNSNN